MCRNVTTRHYKPPQSFQSDEMVFGSDPRSPSRLQNVKSARFFQSFCQGIPINLHFCWGSKHLEAHLSYWFHLLEIDIDHLQSFFSETWCFWSSMLEYLYGGFLKWWYPTTMGFPTKDDHFVVFWGYHHLRKHPYIWMWSTNRNFCMMHQTSSCLMSFKKMCMFFDLSRVSDWYIFEGQPKVARFFFFSFLPHMQVMPPQLIAIFVRSTPHFDG